MMIIFLIKSVTLSMSARALCMSEAIVLLRLSFAQFCNVTPMSEALCTSEGNRQPLYFAVSVLCLWRLSRLSEDVFA